MSRYIRLLFAIALLSLAVPGWAEQTWWNKDWTNRTKVRLDTSGSGLAVDTPLSNVPVLIRLDVARFPFDQARAGGTDLRFVAADDRTPLKYFIEQYDDVNELASIWVQLPRLQANRADDYIWLYYGNEKIGAAGDDSPGTYDSNHVSVFNFAERDGRFRDSTGYATTVVETGAAWQPAGWVGSGASFSGRALVLAAAPALRLDPGQGFTFSAWLRPAGAGTLYRQGPFSFVVDGARLLVRSGTQQVAGGALRTDTWQHVALTVGGGSATLYVDGTAVASGALALPAVQAQVEIGAGLSGDLDVLQLSNVARAAQWIRLSALGEGPQSKLVTVEPAEVAAAGKDHLMYLRVLVDNLTIDAWIVIVILMGMLLAGLVVMWLKAALLARSSRANDRFREKFDELGLNIIQVDRTRHGYEVRQTIEADNDLERNSSLYRMYATAVRELGGRAGSAGAMLERHGLSPQAIESIRASVDATMVRERQRLDSRLVLLTIAISGGPFLGLLGTVVGVMIVFAAVAAAGDVNINAIAPGIAAALLATVAGLAVAIPCLFGYNYLASRVKSIAADMQVFADEITTRLAERFAPAAELRAAAE